MQGKGLLGPSGLAFTSRVRYNSLPLISLRRHSQVVRRGSAKPLFPGSNPGAASNPKRKRRPRITTACVSREESSSRDLRRLREAQQALGAERRVQP